MVILVYGNKSLYTFAAPHPSAPAKTGPYKINAITMGYATSSFYHIPAKVTLLP
jgi:hypothetical protein